MTSDELILSARPTLVKRTFVAASAWRTATSAIDIDTESVVLFR